MRAFIILIFSTFLLSPELYAQEKLPVVGDQAGSNLNVLYRNDASGRIYASSRGFGASFRRGKHITGKIRSYYEVELQGIKHPKEVKVIGTAEDRKRFVYGKLNSVYGLRGNIGLQNVIYSKADNKAVEVRIAYSAGPILAFAKPYYYQLPTSTFDAIPEEVKFKSESFTPDSVVGKGRFSTGLAETVVYPGVSGKLNLSFEYATFSNLIRAIETGICVDFFPKPLPIMARNSKEYFVITLHVGFVFGKKWY